MVNSMSYPPSHDDLVNKALTYLKETHPQDYHGMSTQRRDKYAEEAANRVEGCGRTLIVQGKSESEACKESIPKYADSLQNLAVSSTSVNQSLTKV